MTLRTVETVLEAEMATTCRVIPACCLRHQHCASPHFTQESTVVWRASVTFQGSCCWEGMKGRQG